MYQAKISYGIECYNSYNDSPVAIASLDEFKIENLLYNSNFNVNKFSFIVIKKYTEMESYTVVDPLIVIYDKNIWKIKYELVKKWVNLDLFPSFTSLRIRTICFCYHHSLVYSGRLQKSPCRNQEELIKKYNIIADKLKYKDKYKTLIRKPR